MSEISAGLYTLRFPEALRAIDPEFLERWILPMLNERWQLIPQPQIDFSPLARYDAELPENTPERVRELITFSLEPLTPQEEEAIVADPDAPDREAMLFTACLPAVIAVTLSYFPPGPDFGNHLADGLEELLDVIRNYTPGTYGGFRGYAMWYIRRFYVRTLWRMHPENPFPQSDTLPVEFRLTDREHPFLSPPDVPAPPAALSGFSFARTYRKLHREDPRLFRELMEQMHPREVQVLERVLEEGCLYTLWDAADFFEISPARVHQILRKFQRCIHRMEAAERRRKRLDQFLST